jgi:hypothetical protein
MTEPIVGMRGTKYTIGTEGSIQRDVADKILLLQPDDAPLLIFSRNIGGKEVTDAPKFEWLEDQLLPNTLQITGTGAGSPITCAAGEETRVRVGDILVAPNGEAILVTVIASGSLTVTRAMGTTPTAYDFATPGQVVIAGNALMEGSDYQEFKYTKKEFKFNYVQIFKDSVELTEIQNASKSYGGNDRKFQQMKKAIEHKRAIEQALMFGNKFEDTGGAQTRRGTAGLINSGISNVTDIVGGVITEADLETFCRTLFRYHPTVVAPTKLFICNPVMLSAFTFWAKNALVIDQNEKTYGMRIARYRSAHGDLDIVKHWLLADFNVFSSYSFALDPANVKYRYMAGLDTKFVTDTQPKSVTKTVDEYRTVCGLQLMQEKTHGILKGVTGFAA